jgi:hypothetical protein
MAEPMLVIEFDDKNESQPHLFVLAACLLQHSFAQPCLLQLLLPFIQEHLTLQLIHLLPLLPFLRGHTIIAVIAHSPLPSTFAAHCWLLIIGLGGLATLLACLAPCDHEEFIFIIYI